MLSVPHHLTRDGLHRFCIARRRYLRCSPNRVIAPVDTESSFGKD
jgi:hypothetical protein